MVQDWVPWQTLVNAYYSVWSSRSVPCRHRGGVEVRLYSFLTSSLDGRWEVITTARPVYPGESASIPIYAPECPYNFMPTPGFETRTVQPVASR
jgi:hypothetical protein